MKPMSRRNRRAPDSENQTIEVKNILPLLDITFALLSFFIISALFLNRTQSLPVNLPGAKSAIAQKKPVRATVSVNEGSEVFLNQQKIQVSQLPERLKQLMTSNQDLIVVLNADSRVSHGKVVEIMDQLRQIPRIKMAIATKPL